MTGREFRHPLRVRYHECDPQGHVFNANYLAYADIAVTELYREAFGWDIAGFGDEPYWLVTAGAADEPGADGALIGRGEVHRSPVVVVGVDDIDRVLDRVPQLGAEVIQGKLDIPGVGWSAYIRDTEGNTIGIFQPT